jgi:hypothetical protein
MTDTAAPDATALAGWQLQRIYYNGRPPEVDPLTANGKGRSYCRRIKAACAQRS